MTHTSATTADSDRWTGLHSHDDADERWRQRCCLCLFFPLWWDMAMALAAFLLMIFVAFWVINDGVLSYMRATDHPGWMTLVRKTTNAVVFQVEGFDKQNRRGLFDIVVLKKQFLWVRSRSDQLERNGVVIPLATTAETILDSQMRSALSEAHDVVAVGAASQEGIANIEVARAGRRARETAKLVTPFVEDVPVWTLNLGQYREHNEPVEDAETNWQRPFMVIAVVEKQDKLNLSEALHDAMGGRAELPSPRRYSNFDLKSFP